MKLERWEGGTAESWGGGTEADDPEGRHIGGRGGGGGCKVRKKC